MANKAEIIWTEVCQEACCSHCVEIRVEAPAVVLSNEVASSGLNEG